uniref:ABC transporter domain-containing protein n=1 Tax=Meloidogyne javanica TaxID=6303 RepID=A0A915M3Y1_MELJA
GLSFSVEPGEVVALVGPSGSGKSSCIALLENFYSPSGGKVLIDGIPVCDYEHHYIHEKIALVGQEPVLFARSISENVAYGLDKCTTVDVVEAAKMANAHSFIIQTREQYQTNQRIAIARAIVRKPAILLLDEATSALEGIYRSLVQRQMIGGGGNGNNNGGDIIIGGDPTTSANIGVEEGGEENNNKNLNDGRDSITSLASGGGGRRRSRIGPRIVGSSGLSISPRTMVN